jgi:YD repeat-containing protein
MPPISGGNKKWSVLHQLSGSTIGGASYTLDSAGNRTAKTDQLAAVTSNYTYDAIYQLTQVTQANNTTESYSYDAVGKRTAKISAKQQTPSELAIRKHGYEAVVSDLLARHRNIRVPVWNCVDLRCRCPISKIALHRRQSARKFSDKQHST